MIDGLYIYSEEFKIMFGVGALIIIFVAAIYLMAVWIGKGHENGG